jgi:rhodanese-related sulfurtransferase
MSPAAEPAPDERPATSWRPRKTVEQMVEEAKGRIQNLSIGQLQAELAGGDVQLLDIRDVRERQALGWIPGALHVPRGMLEFWVDPTSAYYRGRVDPEKRIVLYCAAGGRSALAADVLREMGFPNVAHLEVGFNGWSAAGMPTEKPEVTEKDPQ